MKLQVTGYKLQDGFTLIELMVVAGVLVVLSLVTVNLLLTTLVGSTKDKTVQAVKLVGDTSLVQLENMIRTSSKLVDNGKSEVCVPPPGTDALGLENSDGTRKIITLSDKGRMLVNGDYLTAGDVEVTDLKFECTQSGTGAPVFVKVSFVVGKGNAGTDRPEEVYTETFETGVSLRQY